MVARDELGVQGRVMFGSASNVVGNREGFLDILGLCGGIQKNV
jgi:hypothetical protein